MLVLQHKQFAALQRFFVAMSLYPDVQKRAQAELDSVVGDLDDVDLLRWRLLPGGDGECMYGVYHVGVPWQRACRA